ncbi:MAG TPA: FHA domain-containing protein [Bryobacteraceae bacterium]|jgi:hypothetical protein|nr:FHA domain-containing protein [Bryobacteraceae bacterium]
MIRCEEGHFYDPAKHSSCPWCGVPIDTGDVTGNKTRPLGQAAAAAPAAGVTRAFYKEPSGVSPVVGWLVCIEGPDRGQDYRIHMEKNFIGRSRSMDIAIAGDDGISRERHAVVMFDPKKNAFWLQPGDAAGLVYLNGEMVHSPTEIKADDVIELGRTKLVLVPFVSEKYKWT